ncbi:MAG: hypothetical protein M3256_19495 [Actinomycetota bacterium]|nr:hypothetical protein [Actinomycetota bacterium]MDQ6948382.1 hypothetical protein [Actinomycetota bacterium]
MDDDRVERITALLRELHGRLTADPAMPFDEWELQLYAYDEALVTAADIFDIDVRAAARDEMGPDDRADLEQALADAGIDLRTDA